jgi:putative hemolysin
VVPGSFPIHDLEDIGVRLPPGEYATIAGLVLDRLGHLPEPGETVTVDSWRIEVLAMEGRAIARLRLGPAPTAQPAPATEPAATPSP